VQKPVGPAWPSEGQHYPARGTKIEDFREVIDGWLRMDLSAPRKQRRIAKRIFDRLHEEHQAGVPYARVRGCVSLRVQQVFDTRSESAHVKVAIGFAHLQLSAFIRRAALSAQRSGGVRFHHLRFRWPPGRRQD
jgi:hypothetical protein